MPSRTTDPTTIPMIPPAPREVPLEPSLRAESRIVESEVVVLRKELGGKLSLGGGRDRARCEDPRTRRRRERMSWERILDLISGESVFSCFGCFV
jgi:hypothetical protein